MKFIYLDPWLLLGWFLLVVALGLHFYGCGGAPAHPAPVESYLSQYGRCGDQQARLSSRRLGYDVWIIRACGAEMLVHCDAEECDVPRGAW